MKYDIHYIKTEQELDAALAHTLKIFDQPNGHSIAANEREKWLERMASAGDLMLYAESDGEVIAIVFGMIENNASITVGIVAVDERFRKKGIGQELMLLLEKRALERGIHSLYLGAAESAEGFYEKLGYTGTLLIQSERHSVEELLSFNTQYPVVATNVYEGTINQIYLDLKKADRALQRRYERELPGCGTQMVFGKNI
jgi:GNAT superfamily N-acetyltransferase